MTWVVIDNGVLDLVRRFGPFPPDIPEHIVVNLEIAAEGISKWIERVLPPYGPVSVKVDCYFYNNDQTHANWWVENEFSAGIITPYNGTKNPWQNAGTELPAAASLLSALIKVYHKAYTGPAEYHEILARLRGEKVGITAEQIYQEIESQ